MATIANADMPMSLALLSGRAIYWWASLVALLFEFVAIKWIFSISWRRALLASVVANISTLMLGIAFYRYALAWIYVTLLVPPGSLGDISGSLFLITLIDTAIELAVLGVLFSVSIGWRPVLAFFLVNAVSAGFILIAPLALPDERFDTIPQAELQQLEEHYTPELRYMNRLGEALERGAGLADVPRETETRSAEKYLDSVWLAEQRSEVDELRFHELRIHLRSKHPPEKENETWESWFVHLGTDPLKVYRGAMYGYRGDGCSELSDICYSRILVDYDPNEQGAPSAKFEGYLARKNLSNDDYDIVIEAKLPGNF